MQHWADYVIFVAFLCASMGIGIFHALTGGRQRTTEEFIMADRKLKVLPTSISMLVSSQSAIMILGGTAEVYTGGTQAWIWSLVAFPLALIIVQTFVVPWLFPLKLTSVNKFFEMRYGTRDVRTLAACLGILGNLIYMGTATYAPSVALETATGFPLTASIPIMAVVCTLYTTLGGMKAVIWTDVFQFAIMIAGMLAVLVKGYTSVGGFLAAFDSLGSEGRLVWADINPDPTTRHTIWGFSLGLTVFWFYSFGLSQPHVQRFSALETMKKSKMTLLLHVPGILLMVTLTYLIGVTVVAYYINSHCDPFLSDTVRNPNELLPLFVKGKFVGQPGFTGLFLATLYSGALSTISSSLSGSAAIMWEDILQPSFGGMTEFKAALINRALVFIYGLVSIGTAYIAAMVPGPIMQVSNTILGATYGPTLGLFVVGGLRAFRWCSSKGCFLGGITGLCMSFWLTLGPLFMEGRSPSLPRLSVSNCSMPLNATEPVHVPLKGLDLFYGISYMWYVPFGAIVTVIGSVVFGGIIHLCGTRNSYDAPDRVFIKFLHRESDSTKRANTVQLSELALESYFDSSDLKARAGHM